MEKVIEKWDEIINRVKDEHELSKVSFETWIRPLEVYAVDGNKLYILVPSEQNTVREQDCCSAVLVQMIGDMFKEHQVSV